MEDTKLEHILKKENQNKKVSGLLFLGSIILGILYVFLFYKKLPGVSFLVFVSAFYIFSISFLRIKLFGRPFFSSLLLISVLLLSSTYFIFSNPLFSVLNFMLIIVLIVMQHLLSTQQHQFKWDQFQFLGELTRNLFEKLFANFHQFFQHIFFGLRAHEGSYKINTLRKVFIGLLIAIPFIFIVIALLAFADEVFKYYMNNLLQSLKIADFIKQTLLFLFISSMLYGYFWSFTTYKKTENSLQSSQAVKSPARMDPIISLTFIILFNLVYLGFFLVQFAYMFNAIHHVLPENFSYAEYARKGFSELLVIALINFAIYVVYMKFKPIAGKTYKLLVNFFISFLVLATLAILYSAHLRLALYEATYGYTYLRVLTHSFMLLLFVLIVLALFKVWVHRIPLKKLYIAIALVFFVTINFINIDKMIASKNIERYGRVGQIDENYLRKLSFDSYPDLIVFFVQHQASRKTHNLFQEKYEQLSKNTERWVSFNLSKRNAKETLGNYFKIDALRIQPFHNEIQKMEY